MLQTREQYLSQEVSSLEQGSRRGHLRVAVKVGGHAAVVLPEQQNAVTRRRAVSQRWGAVAIRSAPLSSLGVTGVVLAGVTVQCTPPRPAPPPAGLRWTSGSTDPFRSKRHIWHIDVVTMATC